MRLDDEAAAVGVDQRVTLAPVDLLARIVTARATSLGGLDALAVDDRGRGAGVAPDPFAICHHKRVVCPFKAPVVAPGGESAFPSVTYGLVSITESYVSRPVLSLLTSKKSTPP